MKKGTEVIRKTDLNKGRPIFGDIDAFLPGDRVRVYWKVSHTGGVHTATGRAQSSSIKVSALVEATPAIRQQVLARSAQKRAAQARRYLAERPYICLNINPTARVENDGHKGPFHLLDSQVKNGRCFYCGATVVSRCATCEQPAQGGQHCKQCQAQLTLVLQGVRLLNERDPSWLSRANPDTLDMAFHGLCLLSQLYGSFPDGIEQLDLGETFGGDVQDWMGWEYGFTLPPTSIGSIDTLARNYARLTELWCTVITSIRGTSNNMDNPIHTEFEVPSGDGGAGKKEKHG